MAKSTLMIIILSLILSCTRAQAEKTVNIANSFGIGLVAGEPTGISWKLWTDKDKAWDGALAWSFIDNGYLRAHVDHLWHDNNALEVEKGLLPIYYGIGGTIWAGDRTQYDKHFNFGARGIIGMEYIFSEAPVDIFIELAPTLNLIPETGLDLQGGIGVRFFF